MALTLITNRTQADVTRAKTLRTKINTDGWSSLTAAEQSEWLSGMKGAYNYEDLNRVGEAVQYLADQLGGYGYLVEVKPKTNWAENTIPLAGQVETYLNDLNALKAKFYGTTDLPDTMDNIDLEDANNIEKLLIEIEIYINWMVAGFRKSGTFKSGQGVILP